jgi:ubiquinone/menaquinone biosynthesis C-methylase UbiE
VGREARRGRAAKKKGETMPSEMQTIRDQQRQTWDRVSAGWGRWDHIVLPMLSGVGAEMVRALGIDAEAHHLDVASGTGEPGLTIAALAPRGRVVLTDLAEGMLDFAAASADRRGLANIEVRACSADELPFADGTFDSVSCRMGLMFFPDIAGAVTEMRRVLKPGGRLSASVWAAPQDNPWAALPTAIVASEIAMPPPLPDAPGIFRCAAPGMIAEIFAAAGFRDVAEVDIRSVLVIDSAEEFWAFTADVAAPVVAALARTDAQTRDRIKAKVIAATDRFTVDGRVHLPLHARCIVGTR